MSIEEFLIGKVYGKGFNHYRILSYCAPVFCESCMPIESTFKDPFTTLNETSLKNIIKSIKKYHEDNKQLYNELIKLFPEYMI